MEIERKRAELLGSRTLHRNERSAEQTDNPTTASGGYLEVGRRRNNLNGLWQTEGLQAERTCGDQKLSPWTGGDYRNLGTWKRWDLSGRRKAGVNGETTTDEASTRTMEIQTTSNASSTAEQNGATGEGGVFSPESKVQFGEKSIFNKEKYLPLARDVPVPISHLCCSKMKKSPMRTYQKAHKVVPFLGTLAEESRIRQQAWIRSGCNAFNGKNPQSTPIAFWTEQDILQYLVEYGDEIIQMRRDFFMQNLHSGEHTIATLENGIEAIDILEILKRDYSSPIASVYGDIVECDEDGLQYDFSQYMWANEGDPDTFKSILAACMPKKLKCTGCDRTGCVYCCFGFHSEKGETRFQRLARTHPRQYEYCMGGGQWVDNPAYDPTAPEYDGEWKNWNPKKIWVPSKKGLGLKTVFDLVNEIYGKEFYRYE